MNGPYTHTGSIPVTYEVVIKAVLPYQQTDPVEWDYETLLQHLADHVLDVEVESHVLIRECVRE